MAQVNIYEAKTHFSKLVARVLAGEEIVVARAGQPLIKLVAIVPPSPRRVAGSLAGKVHIHDDFDDPMPDDLLEAFESSDVDPEGP